jgi:hypothetical protein
MRNIYEVSIKAGERVLLAVVWRAAKETLIVADGYSCHEQSARTTDRRALHLAEVTRLAMRHGSGQAPMRYPERVAAVPEQARRRRSRALVAAVTGTAALMLAIPLMWRLTVRRAP